MQTIGEPSVTPAGHDAAPASDQCGACPGDCLDACFNDAIIAVPGGFRIQAANCAGCGACLPACEFGHIRLKHGVAQFVLF